MAAPPTRTRTARATAAAVLAVAAAACSTAPADAPAAGSREEVARSVILLVGNGLGQPQREFLRLALAGPTGELQMDRLGVSGSTDTSPAAGGPVTDSAAAATAIATGVRTAVGAVGLDIDEEPLESLLVRARDAGKATGLVTTSEVTDVTTAAFAAHAPPGTTPVEIARQYVEDTGVDVILGGGAEHWSGLVEEAGELDYTVVSDAQQLRTASSERLLGLFAAGPMFEPGPPGEGRYAPAVPLGEMTRAALEALDQRDAGFFLVVAEGGIDEMARHSNGALVLDAGRALEDAVYVAREYQGENPDTLVVVAGDHETGGMGLAATEVGARAGEDGPFAITDSDQQLWVEWTTDGPTPAATPITAGGPGEEAFDGDLLNTQVFTGVLSALSLPA